VFGELGRLAEPDAILATNSSSYPSSRLAVAVESPERLLNVHFQMPPELIAVELMSCGQTDPAVIGALAERLPRYGLVPFTVMRESVGLLFNHIWHATRRECLMVVAEGVSTPAEVDRIWQLSLGTALGPFRLTDRIGLDVTLAVEEHYATIRDGIPTAPRDLLRDYVDKGFLGVKSGRASTTTTATDRRRPRPHHRGARAAPRRLPPHRHPRREPGPSRPVTQQPVPKQHLSKGRIKLEAP
jgi:3-hydroxybutyryl-CoA dehydrogenase